MQESLISVVIPTNKGSDVICRTIDSVLDQSYKNIEIIVIDDNGIGSEEQIKTETKIEKYVDLGQVRYHILDEHKNGSYARNQGFLLSRGEYVSFLDDDDLFLKEKLMAEYCVARKTRCDMVICGAYFVNNSRVGFVERPKKGKHFLFDYLMGKYCFNTSTLLIKRSVIEELNGFDERFFRHQDWEFCTRIISNYEVEVMPNPLVIKIMNPRNYVSNPDKVAEYANFLLKERKDYIDRLGFKQAQKVYEHHYCRVALSYLTAKNFDEAQIYFKRCKKPIISFVKTVMHRLIQGFKAILTHRKIFKSEKLDYLL